MANVIISGLAISASVLNDADLFEIEQAAASKKMAASVLAAYNKSKQPVAFGVAISDETTALTTGTAKATIRAPFAMTVSKIKASLTTASSSGTPTFDVKKGGVSMFSTALTVDANEKTSETAAVPAVLSSTAIAADDELTFDISVAGTGTTGAKIYIVGVAA